MPREYRYRTETVNGTTYELECDACQSIAPLIDYDPGPKGVVTCRHTEENRSERLCQFCYETFLGNIQRYKRQYDGNTVTLATGICQALNLIARKLERSSE